MISPTKNMSVARAQEGSEGAYAEVDTLSGASIILIEKYKQHLDWIRKRISVSN
jgi:hypothetical protein